MLHAIAKLYCVCRRKQLIFNIMYNFKATKSQSRKVIKIASLFKFKVSHTCSAAYNKITKINFLSIQEFFLTKFREKFLLFCFENMAILFSLGFFYTVICNTVRWQTCAKRLCYEKLMKR